MEPLDHESQQELNLITTRHSSLDSCVQQFKQEPTTCQHWGQKYKATQYTGTALHAHSIHTQAHTDTALPTATEKGTPNPASSQGVLKSV